MKLLVVEDELSLLHSIRDYFVQEEFACDGAGTFREAINKIDEINYDCIILDINLPDGNGLQLLQYLRKHEKEDCIVIISARNSLDDKIRGLQLGADDYLTKDDLPSYDFVYSQIKNLKKKLKEKGAEDLIQTIYGIGYKLSI